MKLTKRKTFWASRDYLKWEELNYPELALARLKMNIKDCISLKKGEVKQFELREVK